jgi:anti-sigma factor RsiW
MAHRDGESVDLTSNAVEAHLAGCAACRAAIAELTTLQGRLDRLDYESLDIDVWPQVHDEIVSGIPQARQARRFVLALAAVLVFWRVAQLSLDLPAPVVNSIVPLVLTVLVLWRVTGDPFAIQITARQLQQEGVS